ncbi:MAG: hypothetical protein R3A79_03615 [Nannocystaceae bacterium]
MARSQRRCRFRPRRGIPPRGGPLAPLVAAALVVAACERAGDTGSADAAAAPASDRPAPAADAGVSADAARSEPRWQTRDVLAERLRGGPSGAVAMSPLIEVRDVLKGQARGLYAIHRAGAPTPLRVEHWRFSARPPAGFEPQGEGTPMLRLERDAPRAEALQDFRLFAATPGNTALRRDSGFTSVDELLAALAAAATTIRAPQADGEAQVTALGELVRGLDDALVLERDVLYRVADTFAGGPPEIVARDDLSDRRVRLTVAGPRGRRELEALRLPHGWVLRDFRLPAPAPAPTATTG